MVPDTCADAYPVTTNSLHNLVSSVRHREVQIYKPNNAETRKFLGSMLRIFVREFPNAK